MRLACCSPHEGRQGEGVVEYGYASAYAERFDGPGIVLLRGKCGHGRILGMQKVLVSACLLGEKVRYDGKACTAHGLLDTWTSEGRIVSLCPEMAGGLPVPREPAEIQQGDTDAVLRGTGRVKRRDGNDVTDAFVDGAELALAQCWEHNIKIAILKEGSPSCGSKKINDGRFAGSKIRGEGVTTALLTRHGISVFNEEELEAAARRLAELEGEHDRGQEVR